MNETAKQMTFTVRRTAPTLCLYLAPVANPADDRRRTAEKAFAFGMTDVDTVLRERQQPSAAPARVGVQVFVRRLGDLPPRGSRLVATYQLGSREIVTEEGCPLSDDELARLFTSWYHQIGVPDHQDLDADWLLPAGYYEPSGSFRRMLDWDVPPFTTVVGPAQTATQPMP